jgi:DNA polymerase I-like protein with 3'-5' exonuclease and polymerase domains
VVAKKAEPIADPASMNTVVNLLKFSDLNLNLYAIAFPIQGTASDGFKSALTALDEHLQRLAARIVHVLHDEIIVEAKSEIAGEVSEIVQDLIGRTKDMVG